jgi:AcrR family transcriptional regulator
MRQRLTRAERSEEIRSQLLAAALDVFLELGYHGATLDQIALAAGYTKGAVYSRFDSKADLFLAMVEARIQERGEQNRRLAAGLTGLEGVIELVRRVAELQREDLPWALLLIEFRAHAARQPELVAAYARVHAVTIDRLGALLVEVHGGSSPAQVTVLQQTAHALLGVAAGASLELAAGADAFPPAVVDRIVRGLVAGI